VEPGPLRGLLWGMPGRDPLGSRTVEQDKVCSENYQNATLPRKQKVSSTLCGIAGLRVRGQAMTGVVGGAT
jgi:hypothetical protein